MKRVDNVLALVCGIFLLMIVIVFSIQASRGFDPEYETKKALRTALLGEIFTGDDEADQIEIDRLMELPKYVLAFPTGELAKSNWLFVDESLEYAVEFNWIDSFTVKGKVIFDRTEKRKKR